MEIEHLDSELRAHEHKSQKRFETLHEAIKQSTPHTVAMEQKMTEPVEVKNVFSPGAMPYGGGYGGGFGNDGMGGLLALALLGGGLNNRRGDDTCDASKAAILETGFDGVNHNINTSLLGLTNQLTQGFTNQNSLDVMAKLGSIEAAIPLAESQVQLALAGSTASINKNVTDAIAASLASQNNINQNVSLQGSANIIATKDAQYALATAITADGTATRTLISQLNTDNLNRLLTVADLDRRDEINRGRSREVEVNVSQTVNQNQAQLQQQQQQQQQAIVLDRLCHIIGGLQNAVATNSNLIVGNTGAVATGPQTANPVNVRT